MTPRSLLLTPTASHYPEVSLSGLLSLSLAVRRVLSCGCRHVAPGRHRPAHPGGVLAVHLCPSLATVSRHGDSRCRIQHSKPASSQLNCKEAARSSSRSTGSIQVGARQCLCLPVRKGDKQPLRAGLTTAQKGRSLGCSGKRSQTTTVRKILNTLLPCANPA